MRKDFTRPALDRILDGIVRTKDIFGTVFYVSSDDGPVDVLGATGELKPESRYYIASINKLFVSAIVFRLIGRNRLRLDDSISKHLPEEVVNGLHRLGERDYSNDITIGHLLSMRSGLPCYLLDRRPDGGKAMRELVDGRDQSWPTGRVIDEVKKMKPTFPPGAKGRARYIDTGHRILGMIAGELLGEPIDAVLSNVFRELDMRDTFVFGRRGGEGSTPIRYKSHIRELPLFLASTGDDIVSTARDQMIFLKAFFGGYFIPKERLAECERWNRIFFPFRYGIGIQQFHIPCFLSPLRRVPDMIGHCGSVGSVAFHIPSVGLYVTGTVNQQSRPHAAFRTIINIVGALG